jgi:hypothetical protein
MPKEKYFYIAPDLVACRCIAVERAALAIGAYKDTRTDLPKAT